MKPRAALQLAKRSVFEGVALLGKTAALFSPRSEPDSAKRLLLADRLEYQRPYVEATAACLRHLDGVAVATLPCTSRNSLVRLRETFANSLYDPALVFHFFPHQTHYYPRSAAHLSLPHGFATGRSFDGESIYGAQHLLDRRGAPLYRALFVGSEWERGLAVTEQPRYADRTVAVGDLRLDALQALLPQRAAIRRRLGIAPDEKVVLVVSSWGETSLLESRSEDLVEFLSNPPLGVRPFLSVHQFVRTSAAWKQLGPRLRPWNEPPQPNDTRIPLLDFRWEEAMAAVDGCLFDHSSMAFYAAGIGLPIVRVSSSRMAQDDVPLAILDAAQKPATHFSEGVEALLAMIGGKQQRTTVLDKLFVHRGRAATLHREAVRGILASS